MEQNNQTYNKENLNTPADTGVQQDIQLLPLLHLMAQNFPPIEWLVDGLIPEDAVVLLSGAPASFKTWFALEMARSITAGEKFLGQFNTKPTNVLIMDAESGERQLYDHLTKLNINPESKVYYHCCNGSYLDKDFVTKLEAECWDKDIKLIIFDSLVRFHNANENDAKEMSAVFESFSFLKHHGITSLIICHTRKGNNLGFARSMDSIRGSSDIAASCDLCLSINRSEGSNEVTVSQPKNRFDEELNPFRAKLLKESDSSSKWCFIEFTTTKADIINQRIAAISDFIRKNPGINQKNIIEEFSGSAGLNNDKPIRKILRNLEATGGITRRKGDHNENLYFTTNQPNEKPQNV